MLSCRIQSILLVVALLISSTASAYTIDFDDVPLGGFVGDRLVIEVAGVDITFSGLDLTVFSVSQPVYPGSGRQLVAGGFYGPIEVEIQEGFTFGSIGIVNHVNSDTTRGTAPNLIFPPHSEVDIITGEAFNVHGDLVDSFTSSLEIATLSGTGIVRVSFTAPETAFLLDGFSFTIVPEPNTAMLMMLGLMLISGRRHSAGG